MFFSKTYTSKKSNIQGVLLLNKTIRNFLTPFRVLTFKQSLILCTLEKCVLRERI